MTAGEPESGWPLFPCIVIAISSPGDDGKAETPLCHPKAALPFRGAGAVS